MLNEDNALGFNPKLAKQNIDNFKDEANIAANQLYAAFKYLFEELNNYWSSPIALEFHKVYSNKVNDLYVQIKEDIHQIFISAYAAYNSVALAHGGSKIEQAFNFQLENQISAPFLNSKEITGIDVSKVIRDIIPMFILKANSAINKIEGLPKTIALFDSDKIQQTNYSTGIFNFINKTNDLIDEIVDNIRNEIHEEVSIIEQAKNQAVEELNK